MSSHFPKSSFTYNIALSNPDTEPPSIKSSPLSLYSTYLFPEKSLYKYITSLYPSDTLLINTSSSLIQGIEINKLLISKDDLYQYEQENEHFTYLKIDNVFSELMSWDFIYKQLSVGEESNPTKGNNNRKHISVIFGANASQLLKGLMNMSFKQNGRDNIKVNCYTYCKRMLGFKIIGALRDIKILNDKDISYVIENCINEARILNTSQIGNDSEIKHINLITMSNKNENVANYIFIDIEDNLNENNNDNTPYLSKNDIELYLNCLNNMRITYKKNIYVSIIGCIEINDSNYSNNNNNFDNSDVYINNLNTNVLENIKTLSQDKNNNFKYPITNLYVKPNNENTKEIEIKPIDVSPLSVSVSQLKLSQSKGNKNNNEHQSQKEASTEINYNRRKVNTVSNENDSPELIECKNEIILLKKEKEQLEQLVKLLETSLKYERNEKVSLVNENEMLKQKLKEVTKNQYKK